MVGVALLGPPISTTVCCTRSCCPAPCCREDMVELPEPAIIPRDPIPECTGDPPGRPRLRPTVADVIADTPPSRSRSRGSGGCCSGCCWCGFGTTLPTEYWSRSRTTGDAVAPSMGISPDVGVCIALCPPLSVCEKYVGESVERRSSCVAGESWGARWDLRLSRSIKLHAQSFRSTGVLLAAWTKGSRTYKTCQ